MLLLSSEGYTPQQIAERLHCGDQTVRNAIAAFEHEGLMCLEAKSHRPQHDGRVFDAAELAQLQELVHRSPRDFGLETSMWTLDLLAQVCFEQGIVPRQVSYETIRRALGKLGLNWQQARQRITSHDPAYAVKKSNGSAGSRGRKRSRRP
jgi:transposase